MAQIAKSDPRLRAIADLARTFEPTETDAYTALSALSNNTQIDLVEVFEEEIVLSGSTFKGPVVWHVTLNYGDGADALIVSESFPGAFSGAIDGTKLKMEKMTADTTSFFQ